MSALKLNLGTSQGITDTTSPTGEFKLNQEDAASTAAIIAAMEVRFWLLLVETRWVLGKTYIFKIDRLESNFFARSLCPMQYVNGIISP